MESDQDDRVASLEREVATLRQRVAELQRHTARHHDDHAADRVGNVEVSIFAREALLVEAERIAHVGSWVWDVETNRVFWSDELHRILGYEPGSDSASTEAFFGRVHPEDRERVQTVSTSGIRDGISQQVDYRVLRPDGTIRYVTMDGALLYDGQRKLRRVVGTVRDLTDERAARHKLQRAHEVLEEAQSIAHLGNWTIDIPTGKREWSQELYRILGIDFSVAPSLDLVMAAVHPDDRPRMDRLRGLLTSGAAAEGIEIRIARPDGDVRHVRMQGVARRGIDGAVTEVRGTCLDVTEQVLLRQRLADSQKMEAIGRLAGGIAHDFNNLLTIVSVNLELWRREQRSVSAEIDDAQRAVSSARSLVQRLLAFSGKAQLDRRFVDPNDLVRQTVDLLRRVIGDEIRLSTEFGANLPTVHVDPVQIEQALVNLVVNARDAMPSGGTVTVSTSLVAPSDGKPAIEIAVCDDGPGIEPEVLRRIFEPFFTTKGEGRGTGLGLATVLGTIEQHGGTVNVHSERGGGTTFRVRLPVAVGARTEDVFSRPESRGPTKLPPRATVMVIEDEPMVAAVIARVLGQHGLKVLLANRASEAIALWDRHVEIDAVLCDVSMPEMRGPELVNILRKRGRPLRVLFVTGYSDERIDEQSSQPILTKPFLPDELIRAVARLLAEASG